MVLGFGNNSVIKTSNGDVSISSLRVGDKILGLLDSDNLTEIQIDDILFFSSQQNLKITFSNQKIIVCGYFSSIFSMYEKTFVSAHRLRIGDYVMGEDQHHCVINLELLSYGDLTSLYFKEKASFFVDDILCHNLSEPSRYALFKHGDVNYTQTKINQLSTLIYPEHKYNKSLIVSWKYSSGKIWRKAQNIVSYNFEEDRHGYTFSKGDESLRIKLHLENPITEYKFLLINVFGKETSVDMPCEKYEVNNNSFFVLALSDFEYKNKTEPLELTLSSDNSGVLCNCVLVNESEYRNINTYYQGNLVKKE